MFGYISEVDQYINYRSSKKFNKLLSYQQEKTLLKKLFSPKEYCVNLIGNEGRDVPPYSVIFCEISDEDGKVTFIDTAPYKAIPHPDFCSNQLSTGLKLYELTCHNNAIFDLAWIPGTNQFTTACGDTTTALWDVNSSTSLCVLQGHSCSVKSVCVSSNSPNIVATSSRDGNVLVWDLRAAYSKMLKPVLRVQNAHEMKEIRKRRPGRVRMGFGISQDSRQAVTCVKFQDSNSIITSGAQDGCLKIWDLRSLGMGENKSGKLTKKKSQKAKEVIRYSGTSNRIRGYSSILLDSSKTRMFVSCTDNCIYEYDLLSPTLDGSRLPVHTFVGCYLSSFYIRMSLSPDENFLVSGSDNDCASIWNVASRNSHPIFRLESSTFDQVTSAMWSPYTSDTIVTCSDDCSVHVWTDSCNVYPNSPSDLESSDAMVSRRETSFERSVALEIYQSQLSTSLTPQMNLLTTNRCRDTNILDYLTPPKAPQSPPTSSQLAICSSSDVAGPSYSSDITNLPESEKRSPLEDSTNQTTKRAQRSLISFFTASSDSIKDSLQPLSPRVTSSPTTNRKRKLLKSEAEMNKKSAITLYFPPLDK